jgi:hypothetical protein
MQINGILHTKIKIRNGIHDGSQLCSYANLALLWTNVDQNLNFPTTLNEILPYQILRNSIKRFVVRY